MKLIHYDFNPPKEMKTKHISPCNASFSIQRRSMISCIAASAGLFHGNFPQILLSARASYIDNKTGISLPSPGDIESAIPTAWDPENVIQSMGKSSFTRLDNTPDSIFYTDARFVEHVDANAVQIMTRFLSSFISPGESVLDLCSSWTSHLEPKAAKSLQRVSGLGMNAEELKSNTVLTDWTVLDLNGMPIPKLPYNDDSFDVCLCQLSIDYLIHPLEVMREVGRVLRPNGKVAIIFSNRLFLQKAVGLWTGADDIDHVYTVAAYLHYSNGGFTDIRSLDLSTRKSGKVVGDPIYAVVATKIVNSKL